MPLQKQSLRSTSSSSIHKVNLVSDLNYNVTSVGESVDHLSSAVLPPRLGPMGIHADHVQIPLGDSVEMNAVRSQLVAESEIGAPQALPLPAHRGSRLVDSAPLTHFAVLAQNVLPLEVRDLLQPTTESASVAGPHGRATSSLSSSSLVNSMKSLDQLSKLQESRTLT